MGNCKPQSKIKVNRKPKFIVEQSSARKVNEPEAYRLTMNYLMRILNFENAPLIKSNFLYEKFHKSPNQPQQINIQYQLLSIFYRQHQKTSQEQLNSKQTFQMQIMFKSQVKVRVWIIVGGKQVKSITELYLSIREWVACKYVDVSVSQYSQKQVMLEFGDLLRSELENNEIRVIIESLSIEDGSFLLISTYKMIGVQNKNNCRLELILLKQQLQWNNLLFSLQTIYHQSENQQGPECVICSIEKVTCIFLPCKHMCVGNQCLKQWRKNFSVCPLCKQRVLDILMYQ